MATGFTYRHFILKDHLGSWTTITDAEGQVEQELSYDAWGILRDPDTWCNPTQAEPAEAPMFDRGYTGHEHITAFGLEKQISFSNHKDIESIFGAYFFAGR